MRGTPRPAARSDRTELGIVALVLAASGLVMLAPLLGRWGAAGLASAAMVAAAGCGLAAFATAGVHTVRAARRARPPEDEGGER